MSVVSAGVMVVLVVLSLATSDLARVLSTASRTQTAADAAALAAAQELAAPTRQTTASDVAAEYASRNGATLISCDCPTDGEEATVEVRVPVGHLLLFGSDRTVTASARAVVDRPSPGPG
jgi:secretion/DNA translocation related TadE-like protein